MPPPGLRASQSPLDTVAAAVDIEAKGLSRDEIDRAAADREG
jgi:hypothetical protein